MRIVKRFTCEVKHVWSTLLHILAMCFPYTPVKRMLYRARGIKLGSNVDISEFVFIEEVYPELVSIGDNVDIGPRVMIVTHDSAYHNLNPNVAIRKAPVKIDSGVYIGAGAIILPGVTIGKSSIIGAGAVVTCDIPPNSVFAGVPARFIKKVDADLR